MNRRKKIGIIAGASLAVIIIVVVFMAISVNSAVKNEKILNNVFVDTINVSGMTKKEAKEALDDYLKEVEKTKKSNQDDYLILVNKESAIDENYKPNDLVVPEIRFPYEEIVELIKIIKMKN